MDEAVPSPPLPVYHGYYGRRRRRTDEVGRILTTLPFIYHEHLDPEEDADDEKSSEDFEEADLEEADADTDNDSEPQDPARPMCRCLDAEEDRDEEYSADGVGNW